MHCKKCDAIFFMDKSGKVMMGDPAVINARKSGKDPKQATRKKADYDNPTFTAMLTGLPTPAKAAALVALLAALFFATGMHKKIRFGGGGIPSSLVGRAEYTAMAFADDKPDKLKPIITPGSDAALAEWFSTLRPQFKFNAPQNEATGNVVLLSASSVREDSTSAHLILHLLFLTSTPLPEVAEEKKKQLTQRKLATDPGYKHNGSFDLPTIWVKQCDSWQLDVQRTLDAAKGAPAKPTA
jgi:hypothetical protein